LAQVAAVVLAVAIGAIGANDAARTLPNVTAGSLLGPLLGPWLLSIGGQQASTNTTNTTNTTNDTRR
jgi:formate/nitrite transporter FocA (FNT family)